MLLSIAVLAQQAPAPPGPTAPAKPADPASMWLLPAMMFALITFMLLTSRSQKKREARQRDQMLFQMSKNDRVLTIGGIIGTVIQVKDNEVVLKVDESTNTKMTFLKSAIQRVIGEEGAEAEKK